MPSGRGKNCAREETEVGALCEFDIAISVRYMSSEKYKYINQSIFGISVINMLKACLKYLQRVFTECR